MGLEYMSRIACAPTCDWFEFVWRWRRQVFLRRFCLGGGVGMMLEVCFFLQHSSLWDRGYCMNYRPFPRDIALSCTEPTPYRVLSCTKPLLPRWRLNHSASLLQTTLRRKEAASRKQSIRIPSFLLSMNMSSFVKISGFYKENLVV